MRYLKVLLPVLALALVFASCAAKLPQADVDAANAAFAEAKTAQADVLAADSFKAASDANDALQANLSAKDYGKTKALAAALSAVAVKAKADAVAGLEAAKADVASSGPISPPRSPPCRSSMPRQSPRRRKWTSRPSRQPSRPLQGLTTLRLPPTWSRPRPSSRLSRIASTGSRPLSRPPASPSRAVTEHRREAVPRGRPPLLFAGPRAVPRGNGPVRSARKSAPFVYHPPHEGGGHRDSNRRLYMPVFLGEAGSVIDKLEALAARFRQLDEVVSEPGLARDPPLFREAMRERSRLAVVVEAYPEYREVLASLEGARSIARDESDPEMAGPRARGGRRSSRSAARPSRPSSRTS